MNEIEFAERHFGEHRIKGAEIIPVLCPFCGGGKHRDTDTFALNTENHTYNCRRGSCGVAGHFTELCRRFGESADVRKDPVKTVWMKRTWKKSSAAVLPPDDRVKAYIGSRGITPETMDAYGIGTSENGRIVFPFYRNAEDYMNRRPTFIKYREPKKILPGEEKMRSEAGTEPILFGLHLCVPGRKILYITEGEFDCMSVYQASSGMINVVSVPNGASGFTWIETCRDVTDAYDYIGFLGDSDAPGKKMLADIVSKFGGKTVYVPDFAAYLGCKDANELLYRHGSGAVAEVLAGMKPQPVEGLIDLAEVRTADMSSIGRVLSGISLLDYATGGMFDGDLSVWTGKRGEGKSAFLNQLAVEAVENGAKVCIYSGEVPADRLKYSINLCAAGRENVLSKPDAKTDRPIYYLDEKSETALDGWYGRRIWLYDNRVIEADERDSIIEKFTQAFMCYDCRVFIVDNLMTVAVGARSSEMMQFQAEFITRLRKFAEKYGVHCHVIVHPKKTPEVKDSDEVAGLATITNLACNVFCLKKLDRTAGGFMSEDSRGRSEIVGYNAILAILKNRQHGTTGEIALRYDTDVHRFTQEGMEPRKYSWIKGLESWETVEEIPDM